MATKTGDGDGERLMARMVKHGAEQVEMAELIDRALVQWHITDKDVVSETCIHAGELMASGARNCRRALELMTRMDRTEGEPDPDLATALSKYVQDTCEAIKQVDNALKKKGSGLATLLFEIPDRSQVEMSWRDLVGRRDVIAHQLLTVDDRRVRREAERDFGSLYEMLSRVYFAPVKSDLGAGRYVGPTIRGDALGRLSPAEPGSKVAIGQGLVFIYEDERRGFVVRRLGRGAHNEILLSGSVGAIPISISHPKRGGS